MAARTLTLVAMCLQKLANLVEFGAKVNTNLIVFPASQCDTTLLSVVAGYSQNSLPLKTFNGREYKKSNRKVQAQCYASNTQRVINFLNYATKTRH